MLRCSKGGKTKKGYLVYRRFKRGVDVFDTKTLNLADVWSSSPCAINSLLRIVKSGSTNFSFAARSLNSQLVKHKMCSHFATS